MAPATTQNPEDQVKFLVTCIKYSSGGKVDFASVAADLEIVTKAAAAKRYERLLKAHGITPSSISAANNAGGPSTPKTPATPKRKGAAATPGSAKKRKTKVKDEEDEEAEAADDGADGNSNDDGNDASDAVC